MGLTRGTETKSASLRLWQPWADVWVQASGRSCGDLEVLPSNYPFAACGCRQWSFIPPLLRLRTLSKLVVNQGAGGGLPWRSHGRSSALPVLLFEPISLPL